MKKKYYLKWIKNTEVKQIYRREFLKKGKTKDVVPTLPDKGASEQEKRSIYRKRWAVKNKEKFKRIRARWKKKNRDKMLEIDRKRKRLEYRKYSAAGFTQKSVWVKAK